MTGHLIYSYTRLTLHVTLTGEMRSRDLNCTPNFDAWVGIRRGLVKFMCFSLPLFLINLTNKLYFKFSN